MAALRIKTSSKSSYRETSAFIFLNRCFFKVRKGWNATKELRTDFFATEGTIHNWVIPANLPFAFRRSNFVIAIIKIPRRGKRTACHFRLGILQNVSLASVKRQRNTLRVTCDIVSLRVSSHYLISLSHGNSISDARQRRCAFNNKRAG